MACDQMLIWWFQTKLALMMGSHGHSGGKHSNTHSNSTALQHACSSLCDEIVALWRLAALNPGLAPDERDMLHAQFTAWHLKILDRVVKSRMMPPSYTNKHQQNSRSETELFIGFKPAIEACYLDWEDYPIAGVTHTHDTNPIYYSPFTCFKHTDAKGEGGGGGATASQLNATQALMNNNKHYNYFSASNDHGLHVSAFKQRPERNSYRERFDASGAELFGSPNEQPSINSVLLLARVNAACGIPLAANNQTQQQQQQLPNSVAVATKAVAATTAGSGSGAGGGGGAGDGNRSSASSEGFCENDDDSSSHNYCTERAAGNAAGQKSLTESDSQSSFDAVSGVKNVPISGGGAGATSAGATVALCPVPGTPDYRQQTSSTSDTSSASSASSSALQKCHQHLFLTRS